MAYHFPPFVPLPEESALRQHIISTFPDLPYLGQVTTVDGEPFAEAIDDDLDLWQNLTGKSWKSIPQDFIDRHYMDLSLLTEAAFAAFLPAWMMRALANEDVREFLVYNFAPRDLVPMEWWKYRLAEGFTATQLQCIELFLTSVRNADFYLREDAEAALAALGELKKQTSQHPHQQ